MNYDFVKVATVTPAVKVADPMGNAAQIARLMGVCANDGVELAVFPELCITGYTCGDLLLQQTLLDGASAALTALMQDTQQLNITAVVGLPIPLGGKLYNCAAVIHKGALLGVVPKTHLPNYHEFYELRHFARAPKGNSTVEIGNAAPFGTALLFAPGEYTFAVEICEDLWAPIPPSCRHAAAGAQVIVNLSAGNELVGKADYRRELVKIQSGRLLCGYVYAGAGEGESTADLVFSGHSLIAENGVILAQSTPFMGGITTTELDIGRLNHERRRSNTFTAHAARYQTVAYDGAANGGILSRKFSAHPFVPADATERDARCDLILTMQAAGLKKRLAHTGCAPVLGISGGLDSCLALIVTVKAMDMLSRDRKDILAVTMPCFGTTARTRANAQKLCECFGAQFKEVDITAAVTQHFADIGQDTQPDITYENAQARERTQVLMDLANKAGGLVVGTGDLSELALGWATYNGDHMSMYDVNATVPKTLVRYLVKHYADSTQIMELRGVLQDILDTPVSPELIPPENGEIAQKTEQIVGPYALHDFFLYHFMRFGCPPDKLLYLAEHAFKEMERADIARWLDVFLRRFFTHQFKRSCAPDGPKIGSVGLSPRGDWRMPSDSEGMLWLRSLATTGVRD